MLEVYTIADIVEWLDKKIMIPNPDFQRRFFWPPGAKSYFIDSILRNRPIPNVYFRSQVDLKTKRTYREVVDGQQRVRTIQEFAHNNLTLGSRAGDFSGLTYDDLDDEQQAAFLSYQIGAFQLINADDDVVVDVFKRLNSYGLSVNSQELRHGKYNSDFKWAVEEASKKWAILWDKYKIIGINQRLRMADDEMMAQLFSIVLDGVMDGGQPNIDKIYKRYDKDFPRDAIDKINRTIEYIIGQFDEVLATPISRPPQFMMLFAAVAHACIGIPTGDMDVEMPVRDERALSNLDIAKNNLQILAGVLESEEDDIQERFHSFKLASAGTTQRIKTRKVRFQFMYKALLPEGI
jgi:hypothetical protein